MQNPDLHDLASEAPIHRTVTHECTPEEFDSVVRRVDAGLEWGVGAIVTDARNRVLLIRERDRWQTPGGEVEDGESHEIALRREVEEETGIEVVPGALVAVTENRYVGEGGEERAFAFAHYTAELAGERTGSREPGFAESPGLPDEEIEAVEWFPELPGDTLQADIIRTALK